MTTIVTPATMSTVADSHASMMIALIVTLVLVALVIAKEIALASRPGQRYGRDQVLNIPLLPLLYIFLVIAIWRVIEIFF